MTAKLEMTQTLGPMLEISKLPTCPSQGEFAGGKPKVFRLAPGQSEVPEIFFFHVFLKVLPIHLKITNDMMPCCQLKTTKQSKTMNL